MLDPEPRGKPDDRRAELIDAAWEELLDLARRELRSAGPGHGEERASSLLDEAMVQVLGQRSEIRNASQLRGLTTLFLRRILADRRRRRRVVRDALGARAQVAREAYETEPGSGLSGELAEALIALGEFDERKLACLSLSAARGLGDAEIAEELGISRATVERDLRFARAFVASRLGTRP
jgi:RNA polymerase sigma factor (sigma-70 family)